MNKKTASSKQIATLALKTAIRKKDWERLPNILSLAERYGCSKALKREGWLILGDRLIQKKDFVSAIFAYNSARTTSLMDLNILEKLLQGVNGFYGLFVDKFSREDLVVLKDALDRLLRFYRITKNKKLQGAVQAGDSLVRQVEQQKEIAPSKVETVATFKVAQIQDALYSNMTAEEVMAELARIVTPTIREIIEKRKAEKKKKKKSKKDDSQSNNNH